MVGELAEKSPWLFCALDYRSPGFGMPGEGLTHSLWTCMVWGVGRMWEDIQRQNLIVLDPTGYELEEDERYSRFLKLPGQWVHFIFSFVYIFFFFGLLQGRLPDGILQIVWQWIRFISHQIFSIPPSFVAKCLEMFAFQRQPFIYLLMQQTYIQCWPYAKLEWADAYKYIQKSSESYINLCINSINHISSQKWQASCIWQRTFIQQTLFF